jgi:Recombination endonuclease VII
VSGGFHADVSGLSRAEKRAALLAIQGDACAVCGMARPSCADHDHDTGLLRGMLCKPCNLMEGMTRSQFYKLDKDVLARFDAYRADPPAGKAWLWDLPDDWSPDDTAAVRKSGLTIVEYVLTVRRAPAAA